MYLVVAYNYPLSSDSCIENEQDHIFCISMTTDLRSRHQRANEGYTHRAGSHTYRNSLPLCNRPHWVPLLVYELDDRQKHRFPFVRRLLNEKYPVPDIVEDVRNEIIAVERERGFIGDESKIDFNGLGTVRFVPSDRVNRFLDEHPEERWDLSREGHRNRLLRKVIREDVTAILDSLFVSYTEVRPGLIWLPEFNHESEASDTGSDHLSGDMVLKFDKAPSNANFVALLEKHYGLKKIKPKLRAEALGCLIGAGVRATKLQTFVSISLSPNWYSGKRHSYGKAFTYRHVIGAVKDVSQIGMFVFHKAEQGTREDTQSIFRASDELVEFWSLHNVDRTERKTKPIYLKDENDQHIEVPITPQTERMISQMQRLNDAYQGVIIGYPTCCKKLDGYVRVDVRWVPEAPPHVYRVFNKPDFSEGGRLYGDHCMFPKEIRAGLTLNGKPVIELDYKNMHPAMLFALQDLQLDRDVYDIGLLPRKLWKGVWNTMINSDNKDGKGENRAIKSIMRDFNKGKKGYEQKLLKPITSLMVRRMRRKTPEISRYYLSGEGVRLHRKDSDLILKVLLTLLDEGIIALSVHDSVLVAVEHKDRVMQVMKKCYSEMFNGFNIQVTE